MGWRLRTLLDEGGVSSILTWCLDTNPAGLWWGMWWPAYTLSPGGQQRGVCVKPVLLLPAAGQVRSRCCGRLRCSVVWVAMGVVFLPVLPPPQWLVPGSGEGALPLCCVSLRYLMCSLSDCHADKCCLVSGVSGLV